MGPESRIASPGRAERGGDLQAGNGAADARGGDVHAVGFAVLHHLGIAARDGDSGGARGRPMARTSASSTSVGRPASSTYVTTSASARAPDTARSLTVPLTASSPMDPPGKLSGLTTKLSAVMAMRAPSMLRCAASPSGSEDESKRTGANRPSIKRRLALPPAPCAISICGSRKRILGVAEAMAILLILMIRPMARPMGGSGTAPAQSVR